MAQQPKDQAKEDRTEEAEHICFLLVEGFTLLAFSCAIEPYRIANLVAERDLYRWTLASPDGERAISSSGSVQLVDQGLVDLKHGDRLYVVSGIRPEVPTTPEVIAYLRRQQRLGVHVGAICSGAILLARAGLLDGQPCAVHWDFHDTFLETFPDVILRRSVFVADAPILTASGGPAAADLMLHLIAEKHGPDFAAEIADQMVYNSVRDTDAPQRLSLAAQRGFRNQTVLTAAKLMEENLEETLSIADIAEKMDVSNRQLERLFGKYLHCSPKKYYLDLRLQKARNLLMQSDMPAREVALACGFTALGHFARCFRQVYGVSPTALRVTRAD